MDDHPLSLFKRYGKGRIIKYQPLKTSKEENKVPVDIDNLFTIYYLADTHNFEKVTQLKLRTFASVCFLPHMVPDKTIIFKLNYRYYFYSGSPRQYLTRLRLVRYCLSRLNKGNIGNLTYR